MNLPPELIFLLQEKRNFTVNDAVIIKAIEAADVPLLKWIEKTGYKLMTFHYFITAVRCNRQTIVEWMFPQVEECTLGGINAAAKWGHIDILSWLHGKLSSCEDCTEWPLDSAAELGHIHILDWLEEHCSARASTRAMDWAAAKGQIRALNWLKAHQYGCSEWASELARRFNQPAAVQWLRDNHVYVE